jgi:hypothetical protein
MEDMNRVTEEGEEEGRDRPVLISFMIFKDSKVLAVSAAIWMASSCGKSMLLRRSNGTGCEVEAEGFDVWSVGAGGVA